MRHYPYILIPAFFLALHYFSPKVDPADSIIAGLRQWHDNYPQEKVFVQTDRDQYIAGETIWLKAWCTLDNKPSFLSRILYVVMSDATGNVVDKKMYQLDSASAASGLIDLSKEIKTGNYSISAYTLWMLNYPQFVFRKDIYVYGNDYKTSKAANKTTVKSEVGFFPEGGDLIDGVSSRIAFKAVNASGLPQSCSGAIFNQAGQKVADLRSEHDGMGMFELTPAPNTNYTARITFSDGKTGEFKLPAARPEGLALQVQNVSPSRIALILNRGSLHPEKYNKIFVIGQMSGTPVYKASFNIDEGETGASITKKNLPAGILQVTAFDSSGNPLAERLVFIENYSIAEPSLTIQQKTTTKRGRNVLSFSVDSLNSPDLSVLVLNAALEPELNTKENIASALLLTSDIRGYVNNPGYYFSSKDKQVQQHLDLLLMTQGWRRFTWKQIKGQEEVALAYPIETFINIKGKVTKSDRIETVKAGTVALIIKGEDSTTIMSTALITDKGEFIVDSLAFRNKASVSYIGKNSKNQVPVDVTFYPAHIDSLKRSRYMPTVNLDTATLSDQSSALARYLNASLAIIDSNDRSVLKTVTVRAKKLSKVDSLQREYVSEMYLVSDQSLAVPENTNYLNIWQYLNANVPGFNVNPFQTGGVTYASFSRYDGMSLTDADQSIKFLLNELPVPIETIDALNPSDIALVKVYKGALGFAMGAENGAISVYTRKGVNVKSNVYDNVFGKTEKLGFAFTRQFYNPNYTLHPELNSGTIDRRAVLYWNPKLKKNASGNYLIEFHNDDEAKSFKLIIQGLDANGKLVYKEQLIK